MKPVQRLAMRKLSMLFLFAVISITCHAQITDTTSYFYISSVGQPGKSIGLVSKDTSIAIQPTIVDSPSQLWKWEKGANSYHRLVNKQLGMELCVSAFKDAHEDYKLMFSPIKDQSGQLWWAKAKNGSTRLFCMWLGSEMTLEITKAGTLMIKENSESPTQLWKLVTYGMKQGEKKSTPNSSTATANHEVKPSSERTKPVVSKATQLDTAAIYQIITQELPEKSLGIGTIDGRLEQAMLVLTLNQPLQEWKLSLNPNGFYHITNKYYPSKSLEVRNDGVANDMVVVRPTKDSQEQQWKMVLTPEGGYQITSVWQGDTRTLDFVEDGEEKNEIRIRENNSTVWTFIIKSIPVVAATKPTTNAVVITNKNRLVAGEQLKENARLISANGEYSLVQQPDGNLVIYNSAKKAMWASGMNGKNAKRCVMQKDGNLVQHPGGYDLVLWSTGTKGNIGAYAMLQDDGVLVIVNKEDKIIWSSKN